MTHPLGPSVLQGPQGASGSWETYRPTVLAIDQVTRLRKKTNSCRHPGPQEARCPVCPGHAFSTPVSETQEPGEGLC